MSSDEMDTNNTNKAAALIRASATNDEILLEKDSVKSARTINFAEKMHLVLSNKECQDAVSWLPSGRSFCITSKDKFTSNILPKYFKSRANFNSFERRLKTWGFTKIDASSKVYVFTHDSFSRASQSPDELKSDMTGDNFNVMKQLRLLLSDNEFAGFIWWLPNGESFCVSSTSDIGSKVLFQYFGETQFKSFVATLKREGFRRVKTSEYFGEAVYSHELFRMGRPDLCSRMCRGGGSELNAGIMDTPAAGLGNNRLADTFLMPSALGNNPYGFQGGMNPALFAAQRSNVNFPIPMNNGMQSQFSGAQGMGMAAAAAGIPPGAHGYSNPFAFNRMASSSSQTMADMQMKQLAQANLNHRESLLLKQNQLLSGASSISPLMQQQLQAAGNQNDDIQQHINMLSRRHSLLSPNEQMLHLDQKTDEAESALSAMNRRNSAPIGQQRGASVAAAASLGNNNTDISEMSLEAIEDELLKVKELKLLMMKRKLETQLEANKKE